MLDSVCNNPLLLYIGGWCRQRMSNMRPRGRNRPTPVRPTGKCEGERTVWTFNCIFIDFPVVLLMKTSPTVFHITPFFFFCELRKNFCFILSYCCYCIHPPPHNFTHLFLTIKVIKIEQHVFIMLKLHFYSLF